MITEKAMLIAKTMMDIPKDEELPRRLKGMITQACRLTESAGGIFHSRQAIASIIVCYCQTRSM